MREEPTLINLLIVASVAWLLDTSHTSGTRWDFLNHFPANVGTFHYTIVPEDLLNLAFNGWMSAVFREQSPLFKYTFHPQLEDKHSSSVQKAT